jgi:outer membrane protein assembly factor BamB
VFGNNSGHNEGGSGYHLGVGNFSVDPTLITLRIVQVQALKFIDLLDAQDLLSPEIVDELRRQASDGQSRLTPELIASLLVDNGHLTRFQASKALSDLSSDGPEAAALQGKAGRDTAKSVSDHPVADHPVAAQTSPMLNEELGFEPDVPAVGQRWDENLNEEIVEVENIDPSEVVDAPIVEVADIEPIEIVEAKPDRRPSRSVKKKAKDSIAPVAKKATNVAASKENPWDSFRILGVAFLVAVISIPGALLVRHFWVGNAEDVLKRANEAYLARNFEPAIDFYTNFTTNFRSDENFSFGKVRLALARVRKEVEQAADPNIALKLAEELLPAIATEPALQREQGDVTTVLLNLGGKFNDRADRAKSTEERKALMSDMERLLAMMDDQRLVSTNDRKQQAPSFQRVAEDRQRILRDIEREEELAKALVTIDGKLKANDTLGAYDIRREVISRFPQLEVDQRLTAKVGEATSIQKGLVSPSNLEMQLTSEEQERNFGRSLTLLNCGVGNAPELAGRQLFVRAKGSIYGLDGETGNVLWRQHIGRDLQNDPIRISDAATSDILVMQTSQMRRLTGENGKLQWRSEFSSPVFQPYVDGEEIYITARDGNVVNLDAVTGQAKWSTKIPQPIQVAPGSGMGKSILYVFGESSNLYILSRSDGSCKQVYYLGHRPGAIAVPPVYVLGLLFIFENRGDHSLVRVLKTSDEGLDLVEAQTPFRLKGNIIVPALLERNRMFVNTDLGEINVLDIEPGADKDKVSRFDPVPASKTVPERAYMVAGNNRLWIAENMLRRFDLIVSTGKLDRKWNKHDGDAFAGQPTMVGDTIVHSRAMKGNSGVRVSAVNVENVPYWTTDLAVPVTSISSSGKAEAINSSAMLFGLDPNKPMQTTAAANAAESKRPTANEVPPQLYFRSPTLLSNGNTVLMNASNPSQIAIYSPKENTRLRLLSANFSAAKPTCDPIACNDKFLVGLDSGRMALVDPSNGSLAVTPYQVPIEPNSKFNWNQPAYIAESKSIIASHSHQRLVRLEVKEALEQVAEVQLENPLRGPIVVVANRAFAVESIGSSEKLVAFGIDQLNRLGDQDLPGKAIAGPFVTKQTIYVQCEKHLCAFSADGRPLWTIELATDPLVGPPAVSGTTLIAVSTSGLIWDLNPADGAIIGFVDTHQSLTSMPRVIPKGLLVGGDEGAVLYITLPLPQVSQ